ncbi:hypothetical protein PoB_002344700 [Plakobranchus ocellatus]|uniref:Uncharacterized protein n=1 Tax=Plakobranchus ocellatus TaxID=259542 RepID=A0AAV3ZQK1_9GAST|nr:hypothetical protein PoB_002344700 [Plakobranchus ocellatus]
MTCVKCEGGVRACRPTTGQYTAAPLAAGGDCCVCPEQNMENLSDVLVTSAGALLLPEAEQSSSSSNSGGGRRRRRRSMRRGGRGGRGQDGRGRGLEEEKED